MAANTLLIPTVLTGRGQVGSMNRPQQPLNYRVRLLFEHEQRAPDAVSGPCFCSLEAAELHANSVPQGNHHSVIIEKLAPGGCWLQLLSMS